MGIILSMRSGFGFYFVFLLGFVAGIFFVAQTHTSKARNPLKWLGLRAFLCFARLYTALLHHQICATITKILKASFLHIVLLDISIVAMARASIRSILVLRRLKLFRYRLVCIYFCSFKCR